MTIAIGQRKSLPLPQAQRVLSALVYVGILVLLAFYLNGQPLPPFGLGGLWFYSAFAALVLGEFLIEPFFTRPADAIANSIAILIAVSSVDVTASRVSQAIVREGRYAFIAYALLVLVLAVTAVVAKDRRGRTGTLGRLGFQASGMLGRSATIFSLLLFASGYAAFADNSGKVAALYLAWILVFVAHPIELVIRHLKLFQRSTSSPQLIVEEVRDPGLLRGRLKEGIVAEPGAMVRVRGADEVFGTIVDATSAYREGRVWIATTHAGELAPGAELEVVAADPRPNVIGYVVDHTDLATAIIQAIPKVSEREIAEGDLVGIPIRKTQALYQVMGVELVTANEPGLARDAYHITARKLGHWNEKSSRFEPVSWLPAPGAVAELVQAKKVHLASSYVGHVPGTSFGIAVDTNAAITHNTAIIGILGIGKTHLSWELTSRALGDGVKVIALDITGRYTPRFANVIAPDRSEAQIAARIEPAIQADFTNDTVRNQEAGNVAKFRSLLTAELEAFVKGRERMLVLNPNAFNVSRMEGRPFSGKANSLSRVTMVEITQHIAEEILRLAQGLPPLPIAEDPTGDRARICLVLEEAHSLVPEWNSVTSQAEQQATNASAKAILQGRKYGFGCILITQRTANVTKSILNQCNTVFAMRIYDATGMGFLENYIGTGYAKLLATLKARQAVVFGRGSSCDAPLIVELNNSDEFKKEYWDKAEPEVMQAMAPAQTAAAAVAPVAAVQHPINPEPAEEDPDDIPF